jgi:hypothetical protein
MKRMAKKHFVILFSHVSLLFLFQKDIISGITEEILESKFKPINTTG